ncbi:uncharacterized protein N7482_001678 [Penicillium canariense]|uniref:Uncharacterized protein n=1 Tax=Penicillium canariense TaxID=189055 RepID=A0A9W9IHM0_9EURO|nr:uncharacterized protein N7482_001678 [Penicillium canariense]KAJ5175801.1 hypothetical protein N7482_001678 [Penicillium canariense]
MSATTLAMKTAFTEKEARSALSASSTSTLCTLHDSSPFQPNRTLLIDARGIGCFRLPLPARQTEIAIHDADGKLAYVSTRDRRWSGNSVLSNPQLGNLIRTDYFFGPNRHPTLRLLQTSSVLPEEIQVKGEWTSRSARFTTPSGSEFQWAYAKEKRPDGQKVKLIILRAVGEPDCDHTHPPMQARRLAQLSRCAETRTPATSRCSAGNGGTLQIDEEAVQAHGLDESIVLATCLVMLKREIDRRRMIQMMVIGGAAGG